VQIKDASPEMKKRLSSLGIKAINNAVDITNFVLMETGQPLHAFDYDKLDGGKIVVRRAKAGESIVTLDGIERKLDPSILVIADAQKPVAIAGIMGGKGSEITAQTKNILLESAHFDMGLIRRASRALGLRSDSSYRFERNVNFDGVLTGANRSTELLLQLTGGHLDGRQELSAKMKSMATKIIVRISDIESLLGLKTTALKVKTWLARLGFKVTVKGETLTVIAPANRVDIQQDVDVIEEIARMIGFDNLPAKLPVIKTTNIPVNKRPRDIKNKIRQVLTAGSIDEIITHSMTNTKALDKCNMSNLPTMRILNPMNQDQELMRPSLLPSMLQAAVTNINRGQKDFRFFEIGKRYFIDGEKETLNILLAGRRTQDWRASKKDTVEIFDLKGVLERILESLEITPVYATTPLAVLDPSCSASIMLDGKYLGSLGRIDRKVLNNWEIKNQEIYWAGLHLDEIFSLPGKSIQYQPISEYPAIVRDVSLAVKKEVPYKEIEEICFQQGGDILRSVQFIEQYLGDKIQSGYKGLVFSCQYQSHIRTLREEEVFAVHERILQTLSHDLNAIRR
jgi:phenylalanyl-tRNA synthetase beta chain